MKKVAFADIGNWGMPPNHFKMRSAKFQGEAETGLKTFWCGLSEYEPGGGIEFAGEDSPNEKVYLVIEGQLTVTDKDGKEYVLGPKDSIYIGPNEGRSLINNGKTKATMMVVVNVIPK